MTRITRNGKNVQPLIDRIDAGEDVFLTDLDIDQAEALSAHYQGTDLRGCFTCGVLTTDWDLIPEGYECASCSDENRTDYENKKWGSEEE